MICPNVALVSIHLEEGTPASRAARLIEAWREVPAFMVDRYLNVVAANELSRRLFPGCDPGVNVIRYAFHNKLPWFSPAQMEQLKVVIAAALRDSLDRTSPDDAFVELVGDMAVVDDDFAEVWAEDGNAGADGVVNLNDPTVGPMQLTWQMFDVSDADGARLCVWGTVDDGSAAKLRLIAGAR
jgi:hypothetical protein